MSDDEEPGFRRLNYFRGLRLESDDWQEDQAYYIGKQKIHNVIFHGYGIIPTYKGGLKVRGRRRQDMTFEVETGYATDGEGRDLVHYEPRTMSVDVQKLGALPLTCYVVLQTLERPVAFWIHPTVKTYKGHKRILETTRVIVDTKPPRPEEGVELARIRLEQDTLQITDARDPSDPQPGEIDLRFRSLASGSRVGADHVEALRRLLRQMRGPLGILARKGVSTARDLRSVAMTLSLLVETGSLDAPQVISGARLLVELAGEMDEEAVEVLPGLVGMPSWESWRTTIASLQEVIGEAKPIRGDLENLLTKLGRAAGDLGSAAQVKAPERVEPTPAPVVEEVVAVAPEPAVVVPPPPPPGPPPGYEELSWDELQKSSAIPDKLYMDGKCYLLVDSITMDRRSEGEHSFRIEGATETWSKNSDFTYPDGRRVKARGRAYKGGYSAWTIKNLAPGRDVVLAKRINYVRGDIVTRIEIEGQAVGDWAIEGSDTKHRWRNWLFHVPGSFVTQDKVECRQVQVSATRDVNLFGLWFFQAVE